MYLQTKMQKSCKKSKKDYIYDIKREERNKRYLETQIKKQEKKKKFDEELLMKRTQKSRTLNKNNNHFR